MRECWVWLLLSCRSPLLFCRCYDQVIPSEREPGAHGLGLAGRRESLVVVPRAELSEHLDQGVATCLLSPWTCSSCLVCSRDERFRFCLGPERWCSSCRCSCSGPERCSRSSSRI